MTITNRSRFYLILFLLLFCVAPVSGQNTSKWSLFGRKTINELTKKVDSLQRAYDALYLDYMDIARSLESDEDDEIIDEEGHEIEVVDYTPDDIDSLLNIYYIQKSLDINELYSYPGADTDSLTSKIPDSVYIQRLNDLNSFIPIEFNQIVKNYLILYTEKIKGSSSKIIGLAPYYLPDIEATFNEFGLPLELKAMAIIESAFNPRALSRAKARGMWQFMYVTGKKYGLTINSYVDERCDPAVSCRAAAQYLKDAYDIFGDWPLAISSYNCGAGNVLKAIRRSGGKTNFWDIYDYLPRETRGYFPAFIAALYLLKYYPDHGIAPAQVSLPAHIDTIQVNKMLHFQQISDNIGLPMEVLRELNPQYEQDIIPGNERTYILNLPHNYTMAFVDKEDEIYTYKDSIFFNPVSVKKITEASSSVGGGQRVVHKVKKGETLGTIARKYHTTVSSIKNWNGLRSNTIRVGQRLYIYGSAGGSSSSGKSGSSTSSNSASGNSSYYTIQKGDTLSGIATKTGVSLSTIYKLNNFNSKSKIYPGNKIRIK